MVVSVLVRIGLNWNSNLGPSKKQLARFRDGLNQKMGTFPVAKRPKKSPPKTNLEPQNGGLEDEFPLEKGDFQVPC